MMTVDDQKKLDRDMKRHAVGTFLEKKMLLIRKTYVSQINELILAQPVEELGREVAHDYRGTRSQNALGCLFSHCPEVEHAGLRCCVDHGVFARHLVCSYGHILTKLFRIANDIKVLASGLHHDYI